MPAAFTPTMTAADSVLWTMERDPELRSTVTAVALLDRAPDRDRLRRRVEEAVRLYPRLRQRAVPAPLGFGPPRWSDDPAVDLGYHLRTVAAPPPGDLRWLLDLAASMAEAGFDRNRPLWELVVVEQLADGTAAVVQKVHHAMTDGVGGVALVSALLDPARRARTAGAGRAGATFAGSGTDGAWSAGTGTAAAGARAAGTDSAWIDGAGTAAAGTGEAGRHPARAVVAAPMAAARRLPGVVRAAADPAGLVRSAWRIGTSVARVVAPGGPRRSPVLQGHSANWRFDVLEVPLDALRRAGHASGGTVNDAFVAALAGGFHRYHLAHGLPVAELNLDLPVSIRRAGDPLGGNRFTPVRFAVPIAEPDPAARIRAIGELCRRHRHEPALPLTNAIAAAVDRLPARATTAVMAALLKGTDVVATNVAGVTGRSYIAGAEVRREFGFAPLSGAAVNVALVSHGAIGCVGVNMDRAAVADPEVLVGCLADALDEVVAVAGPARRSP